MKKKKQQSGYPFGQRIREERQLAGHSRYALSNLVPIGLSSIDRWENGHQQPSSKAMSRLLQIYPGLATAIPSAPPIATTMAQPARVIVNRIALVIDLSSSMGSYTTDLERLLRSKLESIREESVKTGQRTDVAVVFFGDFARLGPTYTDIGSNVGNFSLPPLRANGWTALYDATMFGVDFLTNGGTFTKLLPANADVAYLVMVLTDGEENKSRNYPSHSSFAARVQELQGSDRWTFAFQLPGKYALQNFVQKTKIPEGNCRVWDQTVKGFQEATKADNAATSNYFSSRSLGMNSVRTLYTDMANVSTNAVKQAVRQADDISGECEVITCTRDGQRICELIESKGKLYKAGCAYYQLVKTEDFVQPYKKLVLTKVGAPGMYCGTSEIRTLLGLPTDRTIRIVPKDHAGYEIFVQSTSYTRKIPAGTKVIYHPKSAV